MINIIVDLTNEDIKILKGLENEKSYFSKKLIYIENDNKYTIGNIHIVPKTLVNEDYLCEDGFFEIEFTLGSHSKNSYIKHSAKLIYTVVYENILKVLLGEHILVNTVDGERIYINIKESI